MHVLLIPNTRSSLFWYAPHTLQYSTCNKEAWICVYMYMQAPDRGFKSYQRDRAKTSVQLSMGRIEREGINTRSCGFIANDCTLRWPVLLLSHHDCHPIAECSHKPNWQHNSNFHPFSASYHWVVSDISHRKIYLIILICAASSWSTSTDSMRHSPHLAYISTSREGGIACALKVISEIHIQRIYKSESDHYSFFLARVACCRGLPTVSRRSRWPAPWTRGDRVGQGVFEDRALHDEKNVLSCLPIDWGPSFEDMAVRHV
jgi:hypothetical protein